MPNTDNSSADGSNKNTSEKEQLAAVMIGNSSSSLAGFVAAELVAKHVDAEPAAGDFDVWKSHVARRFEELRAALVLSEPALLVNEVRWSRQAFSNRKQPLDLLGKSLEIMKSVVREKLPVDAAEPAASYLDLASEVLKSSDVEKSSVSETEVDRLSLEYLEAVLEGHRSQAIALLVEAVEGGRELFELYENVLVPAQRQVGELWHAGDLCVAEEHFCTATTQQAMSVLTHHSRTSAAQPKPPRGTVLAAATFGNAHDMPLRILADFFEISGWRSILIGQDLPPFELAEGLRAFEVDILLLSAALPVQLPALKETIRQVRQAAPELRFRILVGGRAFDALPDLREKMGADAYAPSARAALDEADRLLG